MRRTLLLSLALLAALALSAETACAAVGCTLNDPDRDIMRIFPEATGYRTEFITIAEQGGDSLRVLVESGLGDKLDPEYEADDLPYAYYTVLKGEDAIGRVHGVNQKGTYGGMQLILATDPDGTVVDFYYQKISSPEAKRFRSEAFTEQFIGLSLADFYRHGSYSEEERTASRLGSMADPSEKSAEDFAATLRGVMKNLILLDEFKLKGRHRLLIMEEQDHETDDD
jgi:hypothetical protein